MMKVKKRMREILIPRHNSFLTSCISRKTLLLQSANSSKTGEQIATAQLGCPSDN